MESKNLWFKSKKYGWGWTPATWQGWAIIIIYTLLTIFILAIDPISWLSYVVTFILTLILLFICYKTGERPRWRWGK